MPISDTSTPPTAAAHKTTTSSTDREVDDEVELRKLDAVFDRIRSNIPDTPYIITVPCAEPRYHHWSKEQAESWCRNTPFGPSEERLQYMSFLYRDHADSCFVCRTEVDEERDRRAAMKAKGVPSGKSIPARSDVPTKKISLATYKNKQANGLLGKQTSSQEHVKKEEGTLANELKHILPEKPAKVQKPPDAQGHKRTYEETEEKPSIPRKSEQSPPSAKKSRTSDSSIEKPMVNTSTNSQSTPHGLPPLVSPISSPNPLGLPPLLSPTLPDVIEAELEKRAEQHKRTTSSTSSSSDQKAPSASTPLTFPDTKSHHNIAPTKSAARVPDKKPADHKPGEDESKATTRQLEPAWKPVKAASESIAGRPKSTAEKPRRLIVKLKYGRKRRHDVERCLRLPPSRKARPKEQDAAVEDSQESERARKVEPPTKRKETPSKEALRKVPPASNGKDNKARHVAEKRPRAADDTPSEAPPVKRPRAPSNLDLERKPRTPIQPPIVSPFLSNKSSAHKPQYITPRRDLNATGMIRSISSDSNGVTITPGQSGTTPSDSKGPTSAPVNGKASEAQIWAKHSRELNDLGRRIKHEAQALTDPRGHPSLKDRKQGAVMSIECILTYMAAYYCMEYKSHLLHLPADLVNSWRTLIPLFRFFKNNCQEFTHLEGLRLQLGAIICARVATIFALHQPSHQNFAESEKDGSSEKTTLTSDKALVIMSDNIRNMAQQAAESRTKLPLEELISSYPKTWAGRAKGAELENSTGDPRSWEKLMPVSLDGAYVLPFGADTTPVQAVRMGVAFVNEWMAKEGVEYKLQLKL